MISDTSNYFGILYFMHADDLLPILKTFDKKGKLITEEILATSCWQGCESDCRSFLEIDTQLNFKSRHEEYLFDFDFIDEEISNCGDFPVKSFGYEKWYHINQNGKLILDKLDSLSHNELMRNPIIHPH